MKTPGQRGAFGEWLTSERLARYETQDEARAAYERLAGLRISDSEYAQWESGSRVPRADNPKLQALYAFYGTRPEERAADSEQTGLAIALSALVKELRTWREEDRKRIAELEVTVDRLVARTPVARGRRGKGAPTAQPAIEG
jgi:transcriptional regulator with XRE-family HTH domain